MRDNFKPGVLGKMERFRDGSHGVTTVRISSDVFVNRLNADL